ncbi:hypothetical protein LTR70_008179 [Exophiala xenobiotica]|uniref:Isochorismatase-like domain-containing protein n=1 Tax=Lithohypha guttulata TaxID=1690604 RepID=A0ABR0K247_9EURO|nr:hypothetical protein LTR24_007766 [Lithohypha guttulata]KAK5312498.1 hypothetical protein LTR70_008179 [Exophiala xenobiotica]
MAPKTALLVVDMQRFFESMTTTAVPNIKKLITHFQSSSSPIIFTQHGHSREELTADPSPNQLVRKWGPGGSIAYGSDDWQFQTEIKKYVEGSKSGAGASGWPKVVAKNTYDAFINTNLDQILREANVERTVVSAFNRGFETWLVSDACGSANKTQHQAGLKGFGFAFGDVLTTDEAVAALKKGE